jgi:hypothetical protein
LEKAEEIGVEKIVGEKIGGEKTVEEKTGVEKIGVDGALSSSQYKQRFILRMFYHGP